MKDSKIISRILRLDKNIYNELLVQKDSLQKSIFIYLTTSVLLTLGVFRFINGILDFIKENLMAFQQELSTQEFSMIRSLIDELEVAFNSENAFSNITSSITSSVISSGVGLVIIYFVLKYPRAIRGATRKPWSYCYILPIGSLVACGRGPCWRNCEWPQL